MINQDTRTTVIQLRKAGQGIKAIARTLKISRNTVKSILQIGSAEIPAMQREEKAWEHVALIQNLQYSCKGNLVRVHEELAARGIGLSYSTLTGFCRRHGIGTKPKERAGTYHFSPGQEMQHDTSPHDVEIGGRIRRVQCASVVLCYSRMLFAMVFATFNRFLCKVFLTEAFRHFDGAAGVCMIDNTSVVIAHGTGKTAVPAPEMQAFEGRFSFKFKAHELGDANRSARVERPFNYIEKNFYAGRTFKDLKDLNQQLFDWCMRDHKRHRRHLQASPIELYQTERPCLNPLPAFVPDVYQLHQRTVDLEGYITLHTNRYSLPADFIGRRIEVRETKDKVKVFKGPRLVVEHERREEGARQRVTLPEHQHPGRRGKSAQKLPPIPEEHTLRAAGPEFAALLDLIKKKHRGRAINPTRTLHRMYLEYPTAILKQAIATAISYGLTDLGRIERMTLRNIAGDFFQLPLPSEKHDDQKKTTNQAPTTHGGTREVATDPEPDDGGPAATYQAPQAAADAPGAEQGTRASGKNETEL